MSSKSFFLGANTPNGFYSLFSELYKPETDNKIYLIKGGPGTGKSSIMKKVATLAENNNYYVERIYCSSDPTSLDALIIPELKISFADATSPHIINPIYPGVCEHTIDLSICWDKNILLKNKSAIKQLTKTNSGYHKKSVDYLKAAALVQREINNTILKITDFDKIKRFTDRLIKHYSSDFIQGERHKRFASALTPVGMVFHHDSIFKDIEHAIILKDKYSVISGVILKQLGDYINKHNIDTTFCMCPFDPENKINHLTISDSLTVSTSDLYHPIATKPTKTVNTDRFINKADLNKVKNKLAFLLKAKHELTGECVNCLTKAKNTHDLLESYYIPAMDFFKVNDIIDNLINEIFE